jgi:APA family basic amino acid/polyamine antiporter
MPLIAVIILAAIILGKEGTDAIAPFRAVDFRVASITAAATLTLWALLGLESATVPAEKVKDPEKTIPRATMIGMTIAGVIYLITCSAIILMSPGEEVANSAAPFADFVARYWGAGAGKMLALFAAISGFGALNGWILIQGELPYAMAKGGVFPKFLAKTSARGTPVRAHIVSSALLTGVVLMNYTKSTAELFTFVLLLSTTSSLVMYLVCSLAALQLQRARRMVASPQLIAIATLAVIYAIWTIYGAGGEAVKWGVALLLAGVPVYFLARRNSDNIEEA